MPAGGLTREFLGHRTAVSSGGGFYLARDEDETDHETRVLGLITMALSYRFSGRRSTRRYWYRTITTDGRDSDVLLLGLGYAF